MTDTAGLKLVLAIIGIVLAVVGIAINSWKVAAIGNTIGVGAILFG